MSPFPWRPEVRETNAGTFTCNSTDMSLDADDRKIIKPDQKAIVMS